MSEASLVKMTLREKILEQLKQEPCTANGLSKNLGVDKSQVKHLLAIMERQKLVVCKRQKKGRVLYKFYTLPH